MSRGPAGGRWSALARHNYRLYFLGQLIAQSGGWMQRVAQAWLVLDLTGSPIALGTVTALQFVPILVFALVSGVVADRLPKHSFLLALQVAGLAQAVVFAALALSGTVQLWHVYVLALWFGTVAAFDGTTQSAFVSEIVGRHDLPSAVALNSSIFNAARIVGPALAGAIIAAQGVGWCLAVYALSYAGVLSSLLLMRPGDLRATQRARPAAFLHQVVDGVRYAVREPALAMPLLLTAFVGTFAYQSSVVLPLLARTAFDVGAVGFGAMNSAMGIGALAGALFVAGRGGPTERTIILTMSGSGLLLLGLGRAPFYELALADLLALGAVSITFSATANTRLQLFCREEYRGRVLSLLVLVSTGLTPIGALLTGFVSDAFGIRVALLVNGGAVLAGAGLGLLSLRRNGVDARARPTANAVAAEPSPVLNE